MGSNVKIGIAEAFCSRAARMGYGIHYAEDRSFLAAVMKGEHELCRLGRDGEIYHNHNREEGMEQERKQVTRMYREVVQAHDLYAKAEPFHAVEAENFRLVSQFGNAVLAAKRDKDFEIRFVTWEYDYDRTGVHHGHYYETNLEGARKDFAVRAGLVKEDELFLEEELKVLYEACIYRGREDTDITYDEEHKLQEVMAKIQYNIPHLLSGCGPENALEQEDGYGI